MVLIKYNSPANLYINKLVLKFGLNEISENDFYSAMQTAGFASRVNRKNIEIIEPKDFPLVKPIIVKEKAKVEEKPKESKESLKEAKLKDLLKNISIEKNKVLLDKLFETDSREKVQEAILKRLEELDKGES